MCSPVSSQGVIALVLDCIDRLHQYSSASDFAESAQGEMGEEWETILNRFYELLGENEHTSTIDTFSFARTQQINYLLTHYL